MLRVSRVVFVVCVGVIVTGLRPAAQNIQAQYVEVGERALDVDVDPATGRVFVAVMEHASPRGAVRVLQQGTLTELARLVPPEGTHVDSVAYALAANRIYIGVRPNYVAVYDATTYGLIGSVLLPVFDPDISDTAVSDIAVNETTGRAYVIGEGTSDQPSWLHVLDTTTVLAVWTVPGESHGVAVNPRTNRIYVPYETDEEVGLVFVLDETAAAVETLTFPDGWATTVAVNVTANLVYVGLSPEDGGFVTILDGDTHVPRRRLADTGTVDLQASAINPGTGNLFVASMTDAVIRGMRRMAPTFTATVTLVREVNEVHDLAADAAAGLLYVPAPCPQAAASDGCLAIFQDRLAGPPVGAGRPN